MGLPLQVLSLILNIHTMNEKVSYFGHGNDDELVTHVTKSLKGGQVVLLPTDTVYGLSADYYCEEARQRIVEIKKRPAHKGFIVLVADIPSLLDFADQKISQAILEQLPAPLTLIVKNKDRKRYDEETLALRIPTDTWLSQVLHRLKRPVISTSANISGEAMAKSHDEFIHFFDSKVDFIVLKRDYEEQSPSTLLDISSEPYKILRQGAFQVSESMLH